jgi:hypothetical protein
MFVRLKMKSLYKSLLVFIGIMLGIILIVALFYGGYKKITKDSDIEVSNNLSINYLDGKNFKTEDSDQLKISITNNSSNVIYYKIGIKKIKGNGQYKLLYKDSTVSEGKLTNKKETKTDLISIDSLETKTYILNITNSDKEILKGTLVLEDEKEEKNTFADTILKNKSFSKDPLTKVGNEVAIEDEGLIKDNDDAGITYYFRGNVKDNYVMFANLLWRIVRINGDGTIRIILNKDINTIASYYSSNNTEYDYLSSNMKDKLNIWYEDNLNNYSNYIASSKFCSDIGHNDKNEYFAYSRVMINKIPTLNCLGITYSTNIGLLTIDEFMYAGGHPTQKNTSFYLYNSEINKEWYTLSGASGDDKTLNMFMIDSNCVPKTNTNGDLNRGVRPVINLIKETEVTGTGTIDDPYTIIEQKN